MRAYYWIDVLDFFKTYDETFGPGFRFQPEQILVETNINMLLQNKLDGMRKHFSDKDIRKEVLENMMTPAHQRLVPEQENEKTNTYKVMSAWHYLERLIESINIYDETEDEKPDRIIFINSANIPYSDDIYLDGDVHFIGTQGVGKSTLCVLSFSFTMPTRNGWAFRWKSRITRITIFPTPIRISFTKWQQRTARSVF